MLFLNDLPHSSFVSSVFINLFYSYVVHLYMDKNTASFLIEDNNCNLAFFNVQSLMSLVHLVSEHVFSV